MSPTDLLSDTQWTFLGPYWEQLSQRQAELAASEPKPVDGVRTTGQTSGEPVEDPSSPIFCQDWPTPVRNPQEPLRWDGVPPVLLLNSRYDPVTPHEWARSVARQSGAVLLTYDGSGHAVYSFGSSCVSAATTRYLIDVVTPPPGTRCPAVQQ
ncbi:alpha/beta hydrolase [Micromonospora sp. NPDC000207]|uniref:alpha/beta hydrolase n=1 Tax=Micromonospora sp. NPDC000207 TaxID=3154246 RepID=UPI00332B63BD